MNQEELDRLRTLIEEAPRCKCGGNCELLEHLAAQVLEIQVHGVGFRLNCPNCEKELFFDHTNSWYTCRDCNKWFRSDVSGALIEIRSNANFELC